MPDVGTNAPGAIMPGSPEAIEEVRIENEAIREREMLALMAETRHSPTADYPPLPYPKHVRVYAEIIRTACALVGVCLNSAVLAIVLTR